MIPKQFIIVYNEKMKKSRSTMTRNIEQNYQKPQNEQKNLT